MMSQSKDEVATSVMGGWEWTMLLALALLWGGSFFFNAVAVRELPSFTLVWLRVAVAAATLLLVPILRGHQRSNLWVMVLLSIGDPTFTRGGPWRTTRREARSD